MTMMNIGNACITLTLSRRGGFEALVLRAPIYGSCARVEGHVQGTADDVAEFGELRAAAIAANHLRPAAV